MAHIPGSALQQMLLGGGGGLFCPSGRWQTLLMRVLVGVACVNLAGVCGTSFEAGARAGGGSVNARFLLDLYLGVRRNTSDNRF